MRPNSVLKQHRFVLFISWFFVIYCFFIFLLLKLHFQETSFLPIFIHLLILLGPSGCILNGAILFLAILPFWKKGTLSKAVEWTGNFPHAVVVGAVLVLAVSSLYVYHAYPFCMDESAPYFQARVFSQGELTGKVPEVIFDRATRLGNFFTGNEVNGIVSGYWPGFALLLTPFMLLGAPWLLNPLISGISLLLIWRICRTLFPYNRNISGWAIWFALGAAAFCVNAISFYSWPAHLCLNLLFVYLLLEISVKRAFWAGVVGSAALVLHNPVPHLLFSTPWILYFLVKRRWRIVPAMLAGYLPLCLSLGVGWVLVKYSLGGATYSSAYNPPEYGNIFSYIWAMIDGKTFGIPDSITAAGVVLKVVKLINWAPPVLIPLAVMGVVQHWDNLHLRLMAFSALLTILGFTFHPDGMGHGWGFRHFHGAWGVIPILAAAAIVDTGKGNVESCRFHSFIGASVFLSILLAIPFYFYNVHGIISQHLAQLPEMDQDKPQVAFIPEGYYTLDLLQYDPTGRSNILFLKSAHDLKDDVEFMREVFPEAKPRGGNPESMVWLLPENPHALLSKRIEKEPK